MIKEIKFYMNGVEANAEVKVTEEKKWLNGVVLKTIWWISLCYSTLTASDGAKPVPLYVRAVVSLSAIQYIGIPSLWI